MANYELADIETLDAYRSTTKTVVKLIKDKELPFLYAEKFSFKFPKGKIAPLFICEKSKIDPALLKAVKAGASTPPAEGMCYRNADDDVVLHVTKGSIAPDKFNVVGIDKVVVVKSQEAAVEKLAKGTEPGTGALDQGGKAGGVKIDLAASKMEQFPDVLKRQQKKLDDDALRLTEITRLQNELRQTITDLGKNKPADTATPKEIKDFKAAVEAATATKLKLSQEFAIVNKRKLFAANLFKEAASAKTDEEKAAVVFSESKFGSALKELDGSAYKAMMETNDAVMVLGRTSDTWKLQLKQEEQPRTLAVEPERYTLTANDAFMKGGIDIKARFQLVSEFSPATIKFLKGKGVTSKMLDEYLEKVKVGEPALWDTRSDRPAVSAREVGQLLDDGYWFGVYPKDDGSQVQMMFPRALKQDQLDEIAKRRKG